MRKHTLVSIVLAVGWLGCTASDPVGVATEETFSKNEVHYVPIRTEAVDTPATADQVDLGVECADGEIELYATTTGIGTHLGKFTGFMDTCVNPATGAFWGKRVSYAANGDELHSQYHGTFGSDPLTAQVTLIGGTGRFAHAHNPPGEPVIATKVDGVTTSVGWISSVGSSK